MPKLFKPIIVCFMLFSVIFGGFSLDLTRDLETSVIDMTKQYLEKNPGTNVIKPAMVVADPEVVPKELQDQSIDKALIPLIEGILSRSTIFDLADRRHITEVLQEQELSLTGLVDNPTVKTGAFTQASLLLTTRVSSLGDSIQITLSIVSIETSEILVSSTITKNSSDLIAAGQQYEQAYLSEHGIGVEVLASPGTFFIDPATLKNSRGIVFGFALAYRPSLNLNISLGIDYSLINQSSNPLENNSIQVPVNDLKNISSVTGYTKASYDNSLSILSPKIGAQLVVPFTKQFNASVGADLKVNIGAITQRIEPFSAIAGFSAATISSTIATLGIEPKVKLQYFLDPRFSLLLGYGYNFSLLLMDNPSYIFRNRNYREDDGPITISDGSNTLDWSPWKDAWTGKNINYLFSGSNLFFGLALYF